MDKKRVVIIDDSASMRRLIVQCLLSDGRFQIVGEAAEPYQAREIIRQTNPDVLTLDVEMPRMDGLTFLERLMRLRPMPVIMLSTETHRGSAAAVEALSLGAVDCIGKPSASATSALSDLGERVFVAANAHVQPRKALGTPPAKAFDWNGKIVLIGASTGGVDALERILCEMPANGPPILIVQHMPKGFLESFAERLSRRLAPSVGLASDREEIRNGRILLAPGGSQHLTVVANRNRPRCRLEEGPKCQGHRPSVDVLFRSAVAIAPRVVSVLLTGMGRDGAAGMRDLRQAGARSIGQNKESCVVYGMPRVAQELGAVGRELPLDRIADAILAETGRRRPVGG